MRFRGFWKEEIFWYHLVVPGFLLGSVAGVVALDHWVRFESPCLDVLKVLMLAVVLPIGGFVAGHCLVRGLWSFIRSSV